MASTILHRKRILIVGKDSFLYNRDSSRGNANKREIDIYLPDLKIGFEVNEFGSHSRTSDFEIFRKGKGYKSGPKYHNEKLRLANLQRISLYFLWKDEIRSGEFKRIINQILDSKLNTILSK